MATDDVEVQLRDQITEGAEVELGGLETLTDKSPDERALLHDAVTLLSWQIE